MTRPELWACGSCRLRFYPACWTCVTNGHRGIDHPEADDDLRTTPDTSRAAE